MYIPRFLSKTFHKALTQFPAVLITGARQAGKSTFLLNEKPGTSYITFDDPLHREFALEDPNGFLAQFDGRPVIIDEIQYVPEILSHIKMRIDQDRRPGIWILTGSQQFHLMKNVSETLAGRIAILELAPFSLGEIPEEKPSLASTLWNGLYPELVCDSSLRDLWLKSYVQTYLERDVRQFDNIRNFRAFEMFVGLCAAYHAQEFHPARLARECGVSQPTIKSWSKILEAGYLALMLPPFLKNYGKRIVKTPKLYYFDSGLVSYLTRQSSGEALIRSNMAGAFFEGLIICETWKQFYNLGMKPAAFYWRSHGGVEVDLIIQAQDKFWPLEVKLTATPTNRHLKSLNQFKKMGANEVAEQGTLLCLVDKPIQMANQNQALPWTHYSRWLSGILAG